MRFFTLLLQSALAYITYSITCKLNYYNPFKYNVMHITFYMFSSLSLHAYSVIYLHIIDISKDI